jgi:hypothetical protein
MTNARFIGFALGKEIPVILSLRSRMTERNAPLFREREGDRHGGVSRLDLVESPATDCILDVVVEFAVARGGRGNRDGDNLAARGNRELERHLAFQARFFLQVLIVDMA